MTYARALSAFLIILAVSSKANETYVWTGGMAGFSGEITLDTSSSPSGGGSLADIVSAEITVPISNYPFGTGSTEYTFNFDSSTAWSNIPFDWNSQTITSMSIDWEDSIFNFPNLGSNSIGDDATDGVGAIEDEMGYWKGNDPLVVPDVASTGGLLALAIGGIGCLRSRFKNCL